jgi:Leucine-rich repeat (LRR) protein
MLDVSQQIITKKIELFDPEKDNFDDFFSDNNFGLVNILLGNNPNLAILDLAENQIENLDLPFLPSLFMLSLRENHPKFSSGLRGQQILTLRSPQLAFLDYHGSSVKTYKEEIKIIHFYEVENKTKW